MNTSSCVLISIYIVKNTFDVLSLKSVPFCVLNKILKTNTWAGKLQRCSPIRIYKQLPNYHVSAVTYTYNINIEDEMLLLSN